MSSNFKKGLKLFPSSGKIRGDLEAMKSEVGNIGEKLDSFSEGTSGSINLYIYLQYTVGNVARSILLVIFSYFILSSHI